ncbi:MAG: NAD(P)/FAD-dependent oxidoreductase [Deltaproteobacteria bacterium]|nr:NAD(P)/FAD-dependent oxidoreductase [Deltaproteobacteria bacterium]
MDSSKADFDVVIIGLGVAGSLLAYNLARSGFKVAGLEKGEKGYVRTVWTNEIPIDTLKSSLLSDSELIYEVMPETMAVLKQSGETAFYIDVRRFVKAIDMEAFVKNYRNAASKLGAKLMYNSEFTGLRANPDNVVCVFKEGKKEFSIESRFVVDCSGVGSIIRRDIFKDQFSEADFIFAYRYKYNVHPKKIKRFWCNRRLADGSAVLSLSEQGGFNTIAIYPNVDEGLVDILCGGSDRNIQKRIAEIVRREFNILKKPLMGGGGIIPIRRPFLRIYENRVFSIGDSASMVYPFCASGVSTIINASEILIDALKRDDPYSYQRNFNLLISRKYAFMAFLRRIIEESDKDEARLLFELFINQVTIKHVFGNKDVLTPENVLLSLFKIPLLFKRPSLLKKFAIYLLAGGLSSVLYYFGHEKDVKPIDLAFIESRLPKLFERLRL